MASRWVLKIFREGDSTAPQGNLCQRFATFTVQELSLMFLGDFLCLSLPLVLLLDTAEESGPVILTPSPQIFMYIDKIPSVFSRPLILVGRPTHNIKRCGH